MAVLPANLSRAPFLLRSQLSLSNLNRTNVGLLDLQTQLATNKQVNRPSDDPVKASAISVLLERIRLGEQRSLSLKHGASVLATLDEALVQIGGLVQEAKGFAAANIGLTSDAGTRAGVAVAVQDTIRGLLGLANTDYAGIHLFGGSTPGTPPVSEVNGSFRYAARGAGLITDLGVGDSLPITLGGGNGIGETSARQRSVADYNPDLTLDTRLSDLRGARGLGVPAGTMNLQVNGGTAIPVDLTGTDNVQGVLAQITAAIRGYETSTGTTVLGPGGVGISSGGLTLDVVAGPSVTFSDPTGSSTAEDLGLISTVFSSLTAPGVDIDPKLTLQTPLASVPGLSPPLSVVRVKQTRGNAVSQRDIDLSSAQTIDDVRRLIEGSNLGVRVSVNEAGTGLDIVNELSGPRLSIEEAGGNTATALGIRTLDFNTAAADFNAGKGVRIVTGATNPITGLPDPAGDTDFRVTLGNGQAFDVDLTAADLTTVQGILTAINAAFTTAIGQPPINGAAPVLAAGQFSASLTNGANGLAFTQTVGGGAITVAKLNNSAAAEDLGLLNTTYTAGTQTLQAQDRAGIRVDNVFTDLVDLRDALLANDSIGIAVAGERLAASGDRVTLANALVGSYGQRVDRATTRLGDQALQDQTLKSELQDVDFAAAATRFSQLQTQLQATLQTSAQFQGRTLFDFLR
ncbi:MAG: flagellin [Phycisphaerales bacterium]